MLLDILKTLNKAQLDAVLAPNGPALVVAGAGSGKTRVLIARLIYLVLEGGVKPGRIVGITFTTQAANEMRERLQRYFDHSQVFLGTFHAFCLRLLRSYANRLGYTHNFTVLDEEDSRHILKQVAKGLDASYVKNFNDLAKAIDYSKNMGLTFEEEEDTWVQRAWEKYQLELKRQDLMDFGDLLVNAKRVLEGFEDVRTRVSSGIDHILVDEAQDTNLVQYELIKLLSKPPHNIFLVGDEDQSIYSFRGARYRNIQDFCEEFKVKNIFKLEQNYRSSQEILAVANAVISHNTERHEKVLYSERSSGIKPRFKGFMDESDEAEYVARAVKSLFNQGKSCAVFYRTNSLSRAIEEAFLRHQIPYRIVGGLKFMERKEIKDLVAWLRFYKNPQDSVAFERIASQLGMGLGRVTLDRIVSGQYANIWEGLKALKPQVWDFLNSIYSIGSKPYSLLKEAIERISYIETLVSKHGKERIDNVLEFLGFAKRFEDEGKTIDDFLDHISLISEVKVDTSVENVPVLMTLHMSKGLEFDAVFLIGFEDGLIPHAFSRDFEQINEERRLLYVGITRAREILHVTWAYSRSSYFGFNREVSRFLHEIPYALIDQDSFDDTGRLFQFRNWEASPQNSSTSCSEGDRVEHYLHGKGTVIKRLSDNKVLVEFDNKELAFVNLSDIKLC